MHNFPDLSAIINFLALTGILVFLLRKPLNKFLGTRSQNMKKSVEEAEQLRIQVEKMVREYESKLGKLDDEVARILEEAKVAGEKEKEKILIRAKVMAEKILEDARIASERERELAKRKLQKQAVSLAAAQAAKVLKNRVTEKDHQLFTQELLKQLEAKHVQKH